MSKPAREIYIVELTPIPWDRDTRPPIVRMRGALKMLLRGFGLRCVSFGPKPPEAEGQAKPENSG